MPFWFNVSVSLPHFLVDMDDADVARAIFGRGGSRQQLESGGDPLDSVPSDCGSGDLLMDDDKSFLVETLLTLVGWGLMSLPNANWIARSAERDLELGFEGRRLKDDGSRQSWSLRWEHEA